jgi:hypothetical protein
MGGWKKSVGFFIYKRRISKQNLANTGAEMEGSRRRSRHKENKIRRSTKRVVEKFRGRDKTKRRGASKKVGGRAVNRAEKCKRAAPGAKAKSGPSRRS